MVIIRTRCPDTKIMIELYRPYVEENLIEENNKKYYKFTCHICKNIHKLDITGL